MRTYCFDCFKVMKKSFLLQVDPSGMPWSPRYDTFLLSRQSVFNRVIDHQRYVAIISNFLDANKSLRYDHNKQEIEVNSFSRLWKTARFFFVS